jgi:two-component system sensor histidine kinase/response regulator
MLSKGERTVANSRILVVEDEIIVAMDLQHELTSLGYRVTGIISSGKEAIDKAGQTRPDLVLMDIRLEGDVDGIEAAEQIRVSFNIPVIFLTAYADADTLQRAKITEPFGYIIKPYQERDLHTTIEMALYKHQMDSKLKAYAAELERRNRELDTFAHTVANNLNSLATIVTNHADFIKDKIRLTDEQYRHIITIARSGRKMSQVIDELLLLAKVRRTDITLKPLHMARTVAEAQQRLSQMIEEYKAEISLPGHWPEVLGYSPWVEEIWVNYLSNGIQYGGQPPRLQIGATIQSNRQVRFWVRDNGPGFTRDEQVHLFRLFKQPDYGEVDERRLRLSIVQHIVEKLGGQVGVESEGIPGRGAIFSFTLPSV